MPLHGQPARRIVLRKHQWQCLFFVLVLIMSASAMATAKRAYPYLKMVDKVKVAVSVSEDVRRQLRMNGVGDPAVEGELKHLAEAKLRDAGISTSGSKDMPEVEINVFTDYATDEFTISVSFSDTVALVRDSGTTFQQTLWTRTGHPAADQVSDLKNCLNLLLDEFIADRYESNSRK